MRMSLVCPEHIGKRPKSRPIQRSKTSDFLDDPSSFQSWLAARGNIRTAKLDWFDYSDVILCITNEYSLVVRLDVATFMDCRQETEESVNASIWSIVTFG